MMNALHPLLRQTQQKQQGIKTTKKLARHYKECVDKCGSNKHWTEHATTRLYHSQLGPSQQGVDPNSKSVMKEHCRHAHCYHSHIISDRPDSVKIHTMQHHHHTHHYVKQTKDCWIRSTYCNGNPPHFEPTKFILQLKLRRVNVQTGLSGT